MKIFFVFLIAIGFAATAAKTKTGKCLSACGKLSVDDIVSLIKTNKIDVPKLLTKLGVDSGTGKPVTKKPATKKPASGKTILNEIKKSLPQRGTVDVAQFKKAISGSKKQTIRQMLDKLANQTSLIFNLEPMSSTVLNTKFNTAPIITKLDQFKQKKVSLARIYDVIASLRSPYVSPSKQPATTAKPSGKSTTPVPSTADLNKIKKSLPQKGTIDVPSLKKLTASLKQPTFGKVLDAVLKQSKNKFNTKSILSSILNTPLTPDSIKKQLAKLPSKSASLPAVYDVIFSLVPSNKPSTTPSSRVTTASSKVTTSPSLKVSTSEPISQPTSAPTSSKKIWNMIVESLHGRSSINTSKLTKSLNGSKNLDFEQILRKIQQALGVKLDLESIPKTVLTSPMDAESIKDALSPLDKNSPISDVLKAVWPMVFGDEDPKTLTTPSSTTSGSSPSSLLTTSSSSITTSSSSITKATPSQSESNIVWDAISKFLPGKKSQSISKLTTFIEKLENPTIKKILKRVFCGAGVKFNFEHPILNTKVPTKPIIAAMGSMKEQSTAQEILDAILPKVFDDDSSVSLTTTTTATSKLPATSAQISSTGSPSNSPFTAAPGSGTTASSKSPASSRPVTKKPKSKSVSKVTVTSASTPLTTSVVAPKPVTAISLVAPKSDDAYKVIVKSVPKQTTINITKLEESMSGMETLTFKQFLKLFAKIGGIIFNLKTVPASVLNIQLNVQSLLNALRPMNGEVIIPEAFNAIWPVVTDSWDENTSSSDGAWNFMVKSFTESGKVDVSKFKKALSGLDSIVFQELLVILQKFGHVKIDMTTLPSSILKSNLKTKPILNALSSMDGKASVPEVFDKIWTSVVDNLNTEDLSSEEESYDSLVMRLPENGPIDVNELKTAFANVKNQNFGEILKAVASAAHFIMDLKQVPSEILNIKVCTATIEKGLNNLNGSASLVQVIDLILPSVPGGRWETVSSSNGTSSTNQAYRSIIITVPHGDVTKTSHGDVAETTTASGVIGSALSNIF